MLDGEAGSFWRLLRDSFKQSFWMGWAVLGGIATVLPIVIALVQRRWLHASNIGWMAWIADYLAEVAVTAALLTVISYLTYAPYRLQKNRRKPFF